jgi:predicted ABC-type ATPase
VSESRWLWLISGPNGAGKSTLAARDFSHLPIVNPDVEAQKLSPNRPGAATVAAGRAARRVVRIRLAGDRSFAVETTLSGRTHLHLIEQAQRDGWRLGLAYVGIESVDAAMLRVLGRYRRGGHDVPPADIRRRYARSLRNLPLAARLVDVGIVYDNTARRGPRRVLELQSRRIVDVVPPVPAWLTAAFAPADIAVGAELG